VGRHGQGHRCDLHCFRPGADQECYLAGQRFTPLGSLAGGG
jgi:hypothetical protein